VKIKTDDDADVNIVSLIDCLMQCIIFFMVIMSAQYVFGVAIKFPSGGKGQANKDQKQEKNIVVFVQMDNFGKDHLLVREGILKLNGQEIGLSTSDDRTKWDAERKRGFDYLEYKMGELIKEGYSKKSMVIQGDVLSYHGKIMAVIDKGKANGIDGFDLTIPE
jgi:biopolymer transport protein ExbD